MQDAALPNESKTTRHVDSNQKDKRTYHEVNDLTLPPTPPNDSRDRNETRNKTKSTLPPQKFNKGKFMNNETMNNKD